MGEFEVICEIEPPTRPDLRHVRHQIGVLSRAGVDAACEQVLALRDSGAFDGVHRIPVARYREVAARLERVVRSSEGGTPAR